MTGGLSSEVQMYKNVGPCYSKKSSLIEGWNKEQWQMCNRFHCFLGACYDITTVGAFTAYAQKYKHGGVRRLLKHMREHFSENIDGKNKIEKVNEILNNMSILRTAIHSYCESVCRAAIQGDSADLNNSMSALADKVRMLSTCICEKWISDWLICNLEISLF